MSNVVNWVIVFIAVVVWFIFSKPHL